MNPDFTKIPYGFAEFPKAQLALSLRDSASPTRWCGR